VNLHEAWTGSSNGIESGRNDVLCRNVVDEQQHPGSKRFDWGHRLCEAARRRREFLHFVAVNAFDQLIARWEMAIEGTGSNARLPRDLLQAGIGALPGKGCLRDFEMRSRLRSASVRGFRAVVERFFVISKILATGGYLR